MRREPLGKTRGWEASVIAKSAMSEWRRCRRAKRQEAGGQALQWAGDHEGIGALNIPECAVG